MSTMSGPERLTALSPVLGAAVAVRLGAVVERPMEVRLADAGPPLPAAPGDLAVPIAWLLGGDERHLGGVTLAEEDVRILAGLVGEPSAAPTDTTDAQFVRRAGLAVATGLAEAASSLLGDQVTAQLSEGAEAVTGGDDGIDLVLTARVRDVFEASVRVLIPLALAQALAAMAPHGTVAVRPARFPAFGPDQPAGDMGGMERVLDVPLTLTVELGRTVKRVKELLQIVPGSVLELDRLAGEPLDIYANQEWVARGEVVVVDETFAIRVTQVGQGNPLGLDHEGGNQGWGPR